MKAQLKTCSRGHTFMKSSSYPVCPQCWPGYYKKKAQEKIPVDLSAPALRALLHEGISTLTQLSKYSEKEISKLHGMGPASLPKLRSALKTQGLSFKKKD